MNDQIRCLGCGQQLAAGPTCSECGIDNQSFEMIRTLPRDSRQDRAVLLFFYFAAVSLALFLVNQVVAIVMFNSPGISQLGAVFFWWHLSKILIGAWALGIAFHFSTWPMRIAQFLLFVPLLMSIWPWLQDLASVLEMPEKIRGLGVPLTDIVRMLASVFSPFVLVAWLLIIRTFMKIAGELRLPRSYELLKIAFWLCAIQFAASGAAEVLSMFSGNTLEPSAVLMSLGIAKSIAWLAGMVLLFLAAIGLRRRVRWLRPPSSHPS